MNLKREDVILTCEIALITILFNLIIGARIMKLKK